jgi:pteridine reductase
MTASTVLVTGAARRIGASIARALHREGMNVIVHYNRSATDANTLCESLNAERAGTARAIQADLLNLDECARLVRTTPVETATPAQWEEIMNSNLRAPFFLAREAASVLRARRGCIVNVGDIHGVRPLRGHAIYSIAKAGLAMLTQALAKELAPEIRVNAVAPGAVMWPDAMEEKLRERIVSHTVLKRAGKPEDVAGAVLFLIRDAGYMTGQVLVVDGGRTLHS